MYMEYSDSQLYLQLLYYQHLFDVQRVLDRSSGDEKQALDKSLMVMSKANGMTAVGATEVESSDKYVALKDTIDKIMKENNYSIVSLHKVFDGYFPGAAGARFRSTESGGINHSQQTSSAMQ